MSKVKDYLNTHANLECLNIMVSNGKVSVNGDIIGEIGKVELSIETPERMLGIYRIEHVMIFDKDNEELYDDQEIVDNSEYHSLEELLETLIQNYGISQSIIELV